MISRIQKYITKNFLIILCFNIVLFPLLFLLSKQDFLIFHIIVEMFTILVGFFTVIIIFITYRTAKEYYLTRLAAGLFFYSIIIFFHSLSYEGMNLILDFGANQATQFWIAANFVLAISVLLSAFKIKKEYYLFYNFFTLLALSIVMIVLIFIGQFPDCYIVGVGLTTFKRISEYVIIAICVGLIIYFIFFNKKFADKNHKSVIAILILFVLSEFSFTLYYDIYGIYTYIGHYFKFFAFTVILVSISMENIKKPLETLYRSIYLEKERQNQLLKKIEISESRNIRAQELGEVGVWELDIKTQKIWASNQAFKIYGLETQADNLLNLKRVQDMVIHEDRKKMDEALSNLIQNDIPYEVEFTILNGKGKHVHIISKASLERDSSNNPVKVLGSISDVTELINKQRELEFMNHHDVLTKIYNRRYYEEKLKSLNTRDKHPLSLILCDVNGLKLINDTFGHQKGDELLIKTAEILKDNIRETDFVSRIGGDEFVVILPNTNNNEAIDILNNIELVINKTMIENINISVAFGLETKQHVKESFEATFKEAEDKMYSYKVTESPSTKNKIVSALFSTLYEKDYFSESHSNRVSELAGLLARELNFSEHKINEIISAGLLHDIGKIAISNDILNKKTKLTDAEFKIIKQHPEIGHRILSSIGEMEDLAGYILQHHERIDGKGYPNGLTGDEICLEAKIIAIADSYDAMTSFRFYKTKLDKKEAIRELKRNRGTQFDAKLTDLFIEKVLAKEQT